MRRRLDCRHGFVTAVAYAEKMRWFPADIVCLSVVFLVLLGGLPSGAQPVADHPFRPGQRVVLNAHNCYPYEGKYQDRIDRALSTGLPVSIELDLAWHREASNPAGGRSVLSHETRTHGDEPSLDQYFFEKVRPIVEKELRNADPSRWPVLYLHFNFKSTEPEHVRYVAATLARYKAWLSSTRRVANVGEVQPIDRKPILVMTETDATEKAVFHDEVPVGQPFYVFGSAPGEPYMPRGETRERQWKRMVETPAAAMLKAPADNYRRWWNNAWAVVEEGGAPHAGSWTPADAARLKALVDHAHGLGYMIRFYTLNGHSTEGGQGWGSGYNFGSLQAARDRWLAAEAAGVDFIATDQYEQLREALPASRPLAAR
jgi:hypothetical protein